MKAPVRVAEPGRKLKVFVAEEDSGSKEPLYFTILHLLHDQGIAGATVFKGTLGFGERRIVHSNSVEALSYSLPVTIEATDTAEKIDRVAPIVAGLVRSGLVEVSDTMISRSALPPLGGKSAC